jgi:hypothetical protein
MERWKAIVHRSRRIKKLLDGWNSHLYGGRDPVIGIYVCHGKEQVEWKRYRVNEQKPVGKNLHRPLFIEKYIGDRSEPQRKNVDNKINNDKKMNNRRNPELRKPYNNITFKTLN